jgi:hypothetical protein
LKKSDLPGFGWSNEGKSWEPAYGGESYGSVYVQDQDKYIFVRHTVSIHSSEDAAQQAYKEWEKEWFDFDLINLQPEVPYTPLDQDDDYRFECSQMKPNDPLIVCFYLQRHNQVISFVGINLDYRSTSNLTFAEINDILAILDQRLNEVVINPKP